MPSFPKPSFIYNYQVDIEINNFRNYQNTASGRAIPAKSSNYLLIAPGILPILVFKIVMIKITN